MGRLGGCFHVKWSLYRSNVVPGLQTASQPDRVFQDFIHSANNLIRYLYFGLAILQRRG